MTPEKLSESTTIERRNVNCFLLNKYITIESF